MTTINVLYPARVITIDGTAGSGKGTISLQLAKKLGWHFLDSGVIYRALSLLYIWNDPNYDPLNLKESRLLDLAVKMQLEIDDQQKVYLNDQNNNKRDVTSIIRTEVFGNLASQLAVIPSVRVALLEKQRQFLRSPGLVADGRDMGTVVFPEAILKFFLDADAKIRATRRHIQLKELGVGGTLHNRIDELSERDLRDSQRVIAPLKPAADAIIIDTTTMTINEVFAIVANQVDLIV